MSAYSRAAGARKVTPQNEPILGREPEMVENNAGGYTFTISPLAQFRRFLILGSEGGTYYVTEQKLTRENAKVASNLFAGDLGLSALEVLEDVVTNGLAPKISPALFAFALAFVDGNRGVKREAQRIFNTVVKTHAQLLEFVSYANALRGWGRVLRETVANWYTSKPIETLGYQLAKYRNRKGFTTADVLRLSHPKPKSDEHNALFQWVVGKYEGLGIPLPAHIYALEGAKTIHEKYRDAFIEENKLTWEMLPTEWLNDPRVWGALLHTMPATAMLRNLGKMSSIGLLAPLSEAEDIICDRFNSQRYVQQSGLHPFSILLTLHTYKSGQGFRGNLSWPVSQRVCAALDKAFYYAFNNVEPSGKKFYIAIDCSGSMEYNKLQNSNLSCRAAAGAIAMAVARTESKYYVAGFTSSMTHLPVSPEMSLDKVVKIINRSDWGPTDCAAPILDALKRNINVDTFVVLTDNETWCGKIHPVQALAQYRKAINPNAKLIVLAMTPTNFSIADPKDPGMLDVAGLDAGAIQVISNFSKGTI